MSMIECPYCHTNVWVSASGICPSCSMVVGGVIVDGQTTVLQPGACDFCNNEQPDVNLCFVVPNNRDFWNIMTIGLGGLAGALFAKKARGYVQCKSCEGCIAASKRSAKWRVKLYSVLFFWSVMGLLLLGISASIDNTSPVWFIYLIQVGLGLYVVGWIVWLQLVHRYVRRATSQLLGAVQDPMLKRLFQIKQWGSVAVDLDRKKPAGSSRIPSQ